MPQPWDPVDPAYPYVTHAVGAPFRKIDEQRESHCFLLKPSGPCFRSQGVALPLVAELWAYNYVSTVDPQSFVADDSQQTASPFHFYSHLFVPDHTGVMSTENVLLVHYSSGRTVIFVYTGFTRLKPRLQSALRECPFATGWDLLPAPRFLEPRSAW